LKNEEKRILWIVKTPEDLKENYMYNFPILAYTIGNISDQGIFHSAKGGIRLSLEKVESEMKDRQDPSGKSSETDVSIECTLDKNEYYEYETPHIECTITNTGNKLLKNLKACIENECETKDLGITQSITLEYDYEVESNEISIKAHNSEVSRTKLESFMLLDEPIIEMKEVEIPKSASYEDVFKISFLLEKISSSNPQDVKTRFIISGMESEFDIKDMAQNQKYEIKLHGSDMLDEKNTASIIIDYKDKQNKRYQVVDELTINRDPLTFGQKVKIGLKKLGRWIMNLF